MSLLRRIAFASIVIAAASACGKKNNDTAGTGSASASDNGSAVASGSASASAGSAVASGSAVSSDQPQVNTPRAGGSDTASGSGSAAAIDTTNMAHKAGNCPSTVAGATTTAEASKDGKSVVLAIASKDAGAVWAIQTRAHHLVDVQNAPDSKVEHTGKGTGGGGGGVCPVVTKDTKVAVENTPDGVKVTMTPTGALKADALKADIDQRIAKSSALTDQIVKTDATTAGRGEGGTGGGTGKHGGNRTGKGDGSGPRNGTGGGTGSGNGQRSAADPNPAAKAGSGHM
jgi:hypothetical protein